MEIKYYGGTCVAVTEGKGVSLIFDPNQEVTAVTGLDKKGYKVQAVTQDNLEGDIKDAYLLKTPGEYEVAGFLVNSYPAAQFTADDDAGRTIFYRITSPKGVSIGFIGRSSESDVESIVDKLSLVDILVLPVGGSGVSFDGVGAAKLTKQLEPSIVIPTMFDDGGSYEAPVAQVSSFCEALGKEKSDDQPSLKLKDAPLAGSPLSVVNLSRQK